MVKKKINLGNGNEIYRDILNSTIIDFEMDEELSIEEYFISGNTFLSIISKNFKLKEKYFVLLEISMDLI